MIPCNTSCFILVEELFKNIKSSNRNSTSKRISYVPIHGLFSIIPILGAPSYDYDSDDEAEFRRRYIQQVKGY